MPVPRPVAEPLPEEERVVVALVDGWLEPAVGVSVAVEVDRGVGFWLSQPANTVTTIANATRMVIGFPLSRTRSLGQRVGPGRGSGSPARAPTWTGSRDS